MSQPPTPGHKHRTRLDLFLRGTHTERRSVVSQGAVDRAGGAHLRGTPYASKAAEFRWPVAAQSVRLARRVVQALCRVTRLSAVCDDAALVVSEMVGNSVRAGCGESLLLRLDWTPRRLRIEVHDDAPGTPRVIQAESDAESGRGMWIVSQLAVRWGVTSKRPGKVVWAEIALPGF